MFITSKIPKRFSSNNLRCFSGVASNLNKQLSNESTLLRRQCGLQRYFSIHGEYLQGTSKNRMTRLFSTSTNNYTNNDIQRPYRGLPALMSFPEIVWPSILKTIKNFIMVHLIIRPYFDRDFTIQDFIAGSKHALSMISSSISSGTDIESLKGLVTEDALCEIKESVAKMTMAQRNDLAVNKDDIYFCFPYQIGIMFDETESVQKRWVEITMVYHVLRGAKDLAERNEPIPFNITQDPQHQEKFSICNYRFIKEFTKEQHSDWVVNVVNHFKPIDRARKYNM